MVCQRIEKGAKKVFYRGKKNFKERCSSEKEEEGRYNNIYKL